MIEAKILGKIRHQNIVKYYYNFIENDKLYLVMEYCEKGDLSQYLERIGNQMEISE